MDDFKNCSKPSTNCAEDSEGIPKNMQCKRVFCAQCIKEFDSHSSPQCPICQLPAIVSQNSDPNKVAVRQPATVLHYLITVYYLFLQLFSLGLIICFIVLFSDKDSGIYDYTALGICLLIDLILIFIGLFSLLYIGIIHNKNKKDTKDPEDPKDHNKTLKAVEIFITFILIVAFYGGVGFFIWGIVVLAKNKNTFTTFTHVVLILSVCYYGVSVLVFVIIVIAGCMGCF